MNEYKSNIGRLDIDIPLHQLAFSFFFSSAFSSFSASAFPEDPPDSLAYTGSLPPLSAYSSIIYFLGSTVSFGASSSSLLKESFSPFYSGMDSVTA